MRITAHFDGACNPNPGKMGIGVVLEGPEGLLKEISERIPGEGTSNVAEYNAIIRVLEESKKLGATEVLIRGDSNLVVQQLQGRFRVTMAHLRPLHDRALALTKEFKDVSVLWIPREQNKRADALAYRAVASEPERKGPKLGSKPSPREHSILCPKCGKPATLSVQKFKDGSEHVRKDCVDHGFLGYTPDTPAFRAQAKRSSPARPQPSKGRAR